MPGIGVLTDLKKADNPNTGAADANKPDIDIADREEANGAKTNGTYVEGAEKSSTGTADLAEVDRADADGAEADKMDKPDIGSANLADLAEANGVDKRSTGILDPTDPAEADRLDKRGRETADPAKPDGLEADGADKPDTGPAAKDPRRRLVERQVAVQSSLFSFVKLLVSSLLFRNRRPPALPQFPELHPPLLPP